MSLSANEIQDFLDEKVAQYNRGSFIQSDPISIPHQFSKKEDIEIAGFLTATIAWGQRKTVLKNAQKMMDLMDRDPHQFILHHKPEDLKRFEGFVHRTFNAIDLQYFCRALQMIYREHNGLEALFANHATAKDTQMAIHHFKQVFFSLDHLKRTQKHVSDPEKKSAAKRINMFLRWMVRKDETGVDFGLWNTISPAALSCPLDVHSGRVARRLSLLKRKQNDAKAVKQLDESLQKLDPSDPVKYDFALFGLGVFEGF